MLWQSQNDKLDFLSPSSVHYLEHMNNKDHRIVVNNLKLNLS